MLRYLGLLLPADRWREVGTEHPFGAQCRGFVDIVPETYDRPTLRAAIAVVPPEVIRNGFLVGTPEQVTVLVPLSAFITVRDFVYAAWAVARITRSLRTG